MSSSLGLAQGDFDMDQNRYVAEARQTKSQTRARRKLSDDQLELLAQAFGSHLIRNAPPHPARSMPWIDRSAKLTAE
jgi:hypothetical protein